MGLTGQCHPPGLAQWCTPEWVVISGGDAEEAAEAARTYRAAGAEVLHTSEMNAVQFRITPAGITARHWMGDEWADVRGR